MTINLGLTRRHQNRPGAAERAKAPLERRATYEEALSVSCPTCFAGIRDNCVTREGRYTKPHSTRKLSSGLETNGKQEGTS